MKLFMRTAPKKKLHEAGKRDEALHWLHEIADPLTNLPFLAYNLHQNIESLKERSGEGGGVEITRRTRLRERMHVRTIVGARDAFSGKMRANRSSLITQKLYKIEQAAISNGGGWMVRYPE